ncbi:hypothetical protein [Microbulbifer sp. JTAC008]|uniref:hypothetical protein n=1 Tax=unclassified Microbulbifer TaxID=2619833 RepID=UPI00403A4D90
MSKRKILVRCVWGVVCVGLLFSLYPFVESLKPSAVTDRPLTVSVYSIPKGKMKIYEYEGRPLAVYRPTEEYLKELVANNKLTNGPYYSEGAIPDFFVYYPLGVHSACLLKDSSGFSIDIPLHGLLDPCHLGFWDYSGRFIKGVNNPEGVQLKNLEVEDNYRWESGGVIRFPKKQIVIN